MRPSPPPEKVGLSSQTCTQVLSENYILSNPILFIPQPVIGFALPVGSPSSRSSLHWAARDSDKHGAKFSRNFSGAGISHFPSGDIWARLTDSSGSVGRATVLRIAPVQIPSASSKPIATLMMRRVRVMDIPRRLSVGPGAGLTPIERGEPCQAGRGDSSAAFVTLRGFFLNRSFATRRLKQPDSVSLSNLPYEVLASRRRPPNHDGSGFTCVAAVGEAVLWLRLDFLGKRAITDSR